MIQAEPDAQAPSVLRIHAIELFILHLPAGGPEPFYRVGDHYRVLMRIHTSSGIGWGEIHLNEGSRPADWVTWASWYNKFLHRRFADEHSLQNDILHSIHPQLLSRVQLLSDAIQGAAARTAQPGESCHLLEIAEAYVSLF